MTDDRAERLRAAFYLNLEQQRKRAKDLLREAKAGDEAALRRLASARSGDPRAAKLTDAQFAIARELRFESWPKLKAHIEGLERQHAAIDRKEPAPDGGMKTLHLRCGHDIMSILKDAGFAGEFLPHTNPYSQGPLTHTSDYYELRARFVLDAFGSRLPERGLTFEGLVHGFRRDDEEVARAARDFERIVLWAEHDNVDQMMVVRIMSLFRHGDRPRVFEYIRLNDFPGGTRFLGLGQLPPEALRMLWTTRRPVTQEMLAFGDRAWDAARLEDPRAFAAIARMTQAPLPDVPAVAYRHLQELPSVENGLSLSERLVLEILSEAGSCTINQVFWDLLHGREPLFFMGDLGVANVIQAMERGSEPVFTRTREQPDEREFRNRLEITDLGRAVLAGERDWLSLRPPERWVGGVRITPGQPCWRWDEAKRSPVLTSP